jgi:hypothetical protein
VIRAAGVSPLAPTLTLSPEDNTMNPLYDGFPTAPEVSRTPQLAVTGLLREALYAADLSLRAVHPDLRDAFPAAGSRLLPSAELARLILQHMNLLADLLTRYRATLDDEWHRPWFLADPDRSRWSPNENEPS